MFKNSHRLFEIMGFEVRVDVSWIFIALLVTWSLSAGYFPTHNPGFAPGTYVAMGVAGALGLFISIVIHEFSHSWIARRYGIAIKGITLFIFGGVAELGDEPRKPKAEFAMAAAGPIASILLGIACGTLQRALQLVHGSVVAQSVFAYLSWINLSLAAFNCIPAFPLDGGRMLRAAVWAKTRNLRRATRIATSLGSAFGTVLVLLGIVSIVTGSFIAGMWGFLIGMFLRNAAGASYRDYLFRELLGKHTVAAVMTTEPVCVPDSATLEELVNDYIYRFHHRMFPVISPGDGKLVGNISAHNVQIIPRGNWPRVQVGELMQLCESNNTIQPGAIVREALQKMEKSGGRLVVVDGDKPVGILTMKDVISLFTLKLELGEGGSGRRQARKASKKTALRAFKKAQI